MVTPPEKNKARPMRPEDSILESTFQHADLLYSREKANELRETMRRVIRRMQVPHDADNNDLNLNPPMQSASERML